MRCKSRKIICAFVMVMMLMAGTSVSAFAADINMDKEPAVLYSIDMDDTTLVGAVHISSDTYVENGRMVTVDIYRQPDGTIITDTFERSAVALFSKEGSDTATRTRNIKEWGSISITASFKWYTEGLFSYVKCTSMSASHNLDKKAVVSKWEKSYTEDYVSIGAAKASVKYKMYNSQVPVQFQEGTFTITCTDDGKISDNG